MGSRVYAPGIGRFLSVDPTPGGNANIYDYCTADPVNCTDLTGNWPDWGAVLNVVAVVAEVVATGVPGPIGTAAGFISAGAYLATGNTSKATEMALVATAQLVGAGLAARAAVQYASKIGRATQKAMSKVARAAVASQCFTAGTQILMADGTTKNIEDIRVGDHVTSTDPDTGVTTTQAVAQLFQHDAPDLLTITIGHDPITVTAEHPFYVPGQGWTPAQHLRPSDPLRTPTGTTITITITITITTVRAGPTLSTVYNFEVTNTHTYYIHTPTSPILVHNTCAKGGVYALVTEHGTVVRTGRTGNLAKREVQHATRYKNLRFETLYQTDNRAARRGLEAMVEGQYRPVLNRIRAISPLNPNRGRYIKAANNFLRRGA